MAHENFMTPWDEAKRQEYMATRPRPTATLPTGDTKPPQNPPFEPIVEYPVPPPKEDK